jgi:hypothetical protein
MMTRPRLMRRIASKNWCPGWAMNKYIKLSKYY